MSETDHRIEWIDIFKALAITCVVLGHATGLFNIYIYQFHMAAFFFISGYTANFDKRSFWQNLWLKVYSLILPICTVFFIFLLLLNIFYYCFPDVNLNQPFDTNLSNTFIISEFIKGRTYISWLGATWFLVILFKVFVLQNLIYILSRKNELLHAVITVALYLCGYYFLSQKTYSWLDLSCIAQFYFAAGMLLKKHSIPIQNKYKKAALELAGLTFSLYLLYYYGNMQGITVDYPSRNFGNPWRNCLVALNGIVFLWTLSKILTRLPQIFRNILSYIGQNTLPIVFMHFLLFKAVYLLIGVDIQNFTPPEATERRYYFLLISVAISGSIFFWKLLCTNKYMQFFLAQEPLKFSTLYKSLTAKLNFRQYFSNNCLKNHRHFKLSSQQLCMLIPVLILVLIVISQLLSQGIILNDEVQSRFARMFGFTSMLKRFLLGEINQGRPLRIMAAFNHAASFISSSYITSRSIQIITILLVHVLFGYLLFLLFNRKGFAVFASVISLVVLPITFEHAAPNAFVGFTALPLAYFFISTILFVKYLRNNQKCYMLISTLFWIITLLSYEFMVTLVLFFPLIAFSERTNSINTDTHLIKTTLIPILFSVLYITALLTVLKFITAGYDGAKLAFISIKSTLAILYTLFLSAMPGYYLFNEKYKYLFTMYSDYSFPFYNINELTYGNFIEILSWFAQEFLSFQFIISYISLFVFCYFNFTSEKNLNESSPFPKTLPLILFIYMFIPSLPNALSKMYQGQVTAKFFTGLPVSFSLHFIAVTLISLVLWLFMQKSNLRSVTGKILLFAICLYCSCVLHMNSVIAKEQNSNWQRMRIIEKLFDTSVFKAMRNNSLYAADLYKTNNLLAFHSGYWTQFAKYKNLDIKITGKSQALQTETFVLNEMKRNGLLFMISGGVERIILSTRAEDGSIPIPLSNNNYIITKLGSPFYDNGFFCYPFIIKHTDKTQIIKYNEMYNGIPFQLLCRAGSTLKTATKIKGIYEDGWLSKKAHMIIFSEKKISMTIKCYYPGVINGSQKITIFTDGKLNTEHTVTQAFFEIKINVPSNANVDVTLISNFTMPSNRVDQRELSFIISEIY